MWQAWSRYLWRWLVPLGTTAVVLGLLLLLTPDAPLDFSSETPETLPTHSTRRRVVIFIIDTTDAFEAHGAYVQSVVQQQCARCALQPVNLHGDLSIPSLLHATEHVRTVSSTYHATTTVVVNFSLGSYTYDAALHAQVRALAASGVLVIASAGNDATSRPFYPAAFPEVFAVCSSTRHTRAKAAYSNFGPWVSLCAPGLQYVARPLQQGALASGTSFAGPMLAGALGQLLLDAPCAAPRTGLRALRRTADALAGEPASTTTGLLNITAAAHYLQVLYACDTLRQSVWQRLLARTAYLGHGVLLTLGVLVYFFVSVFAAPLLFAFTTESLRQRALARQHQAIFWAYAGSTAYRHHRLQVLLQHYARSRTVRRRHQAELVALLHACDVYGETCGWCGLATVREPGEEEGAVAGMWCSRCGWDVDGSE